MRHRSSLPDSRVVYSVFTVLCDSNIQLITATQVTTLAGSGTGGSLDGAALSSQFHWPTGLASDSGGNVFVADNLNNIIRRIDWLTRVVSTVAGSGILAELDGVGTTARFNSPYGLALLNGAIWVADNYEPGTVRRIGMVFVVHIQFHSVVSLLSNPYNLTFFQCFHARLLVMYYEEARYAMYNVPREAILHPAPVCALHVRWGTLHQYAHVDLNHIHYPRVFWSV